MLELAKVGLLKGTGNKGAINFVAPFCFLSACVKRVLTIPQPARTVQSALATE